MSIVIALIIFSALILIHEFGHFLLARKNGITVNEFSIGMGPRLVSFGKGPTKYSIKLFPFGGSCAMLGEDEDVETEGSFNSKSVWARMAVVFAGPLFNFILAFVLAFSVIAYAGADVSYVESIDQSSDAYRAGLRKGDRILKYNGAHALIGREIYLEQLADPLDGEKIKIKYRRGRKSQTLSYQPECEEKYIAGMSYSATDDPAEITVTKGSAIEKAGALNGDVITAIDGNSIESGAALSAYTDAHPWDGSEVDITILRNKKTLKISLTPQMTKVYTDGFSYNLVREKQSFAGILKYSLIEVRYQIVTVLKSLKMLITGKAGVRDLSGPVGIVDAIGDTYNSTKSEGALMTFMTMLNMAIMLSANLGVMNLLPLPALDGGRLVFLIIEAIRGKPVDREKEGFVHFIGLALLMVLMVFLLFNDVGKMF